MPKLNDALRLYMAGQQASTARLGGSLVWTAPMVPANTSPPVVSGALFVGDIATTTNGTWTQSPTSYTYQWQVDPGTGWENVEDATASTFETPAVGEYRVCVTAHNALGASVPAASDSFIITEGGADVFAILSGSTPNAVLSGGGRILTQTGAGFGTALSDTVLHEDFYAEVRIDGIGMGGLSLYSEELDPEDLPTYSVPGQLWGAEGLSAYGDDWQANWWAFEGLPANASGAIQSFGSAATGAQYLQIAYRHATRAIWLRIRSGTTTSAWARGGNPETNTTPTFTWPNANPIRLGVTTDSTGVARLLLPEEFVSVPPAGFNLGLREP